MRCYQLDLFTDIIKVFLIRNDEGDMWTKERFSSIDCLALEFDSEKEAKKEIERLIKQNKKRRKPRLRVSVRTFTVDEI